MKLAIEPKLRTLNPTEKNLNKLLLQWPMAKFKDKERVEKKKLSKAFWLGAFVIFIMVMSVMGYIENKDNSEVRKYNDFTFSGGNGKWTTKIEGKAYTFSYHPTDIEKIPLDAAIVSRISGTKMIYTTYDPDSRYAEDMALSQFVIGNNLWDYSRTYSQPAFSNSSSYNMPVADCRNATLYVPVIRLVEGKNMSITMKDNCIILEGSSSTDFLAMTERLLYGLMGVIK